MAKVQSYATFGGLPVYLDPQAIDAARGLANGYWCPLGFEPGIGYVLLTRRDYQRLSSPASLVIHDKTNLTLPSLYVISAVRVTGGPRGGDDSLYLVKFTDKRWFARMSFVKKAYNVRCPAPPAASGASLYYAETLNAGAVWTWQTMVTDLTGAIPGWSGSATLPYTPAGTPEGFQFWGMSAAEALETVLERIDCRLVYRATNGGYAIIQTGQVQSLLSTLTAVYSQFLVDADPFDVVGMLGAEKVEVCFRRRDVNYGSEAFTQRTTGSWSTNPVYVVEVATGLTGALAGTKEAIWDDLPALYNFDGTLSNSAALSTRATDRKNSYVTERTVSSLRRRTVYSGPVPFEVGSQLKAVLWRDWGDGWVTEISNHPGEPACPFPSDKGLVGLGALVPQEHNAPPDLARHTHPLYPPLSQLVRVAGSGGGLAAPSGSTGMFDGVVLRVDATADFGSADPYVDGEACWLAVVNPLTGSQFVDSTLFAGDRYVARLNGSADVGGTVRPVYLLLRPENQVFRSDLPAGSAGDPVSVLLSDGRTVSAELLTDAGAEDSGVTFFDFGLGSWHSFVPGGSGGADNTAIVEVADDVHDEATCLWPGLIKTISGEFTGACSNPFSGSTACHLLVLNSAGGSWSGSKFTLTVGDKYIGRKVATLEGANVYAIRHNPVGTTLYKGALTASLGFADANASVDSLVSFSADAAPAGTISAANLLHWAGDSSEVAIVIRDDNAGGYKLLGVEWDQLDRVYDVEYRLLTHTLMEHKRSFVGKNAANATENAVLAAVEVDWIEDLTYDDELGLDAVKRESSWMLGELGTTSDLDIVGTVSRPVVTNAVWDGTSLKQTKYELTFLGSESALGDSTVFTTVLAPVVYNVELAGLVFLQYKYYVQVFSAAGAAAFPVFVGTECEEVAVAAEAAAMPAVYDGGDFGLIEASSYGG